jgi:hypothetical protein
MFKYIIVATSFVVSVCYFGAAQAVAETVKPLHGVSFHTETKDAFAYYLADNGTCKLVLTFTDRTDYAPARLEATVEPGKSSVYQVDKGHTLEFACNANAQAMTINLLSTVAAKR